MLVQITAKDFKSFANLDVPLAPVTLLVGPNASGKSNFLDLLRTFQGLGLGYSVEQTLEGRSEGQREQWPGIRGGVVEVIRRSPGKPPYEARLSAAWRHDDEIITHRIWLVANAQLSAIRLEKLSSSTRTLFRNDSMAEEEFLEKYFHPPDRMSGTALFDFDPARNVPPHMQFQSGGQTVRVEPMAQVSTRHSILPQLALEHRVSAAAAAARDRVIETWTKAAFYELRPEMMRGYVPRSRVGLGVHGEYLAAFLRAKVTTEDEVRGLADWVSELCGPDVERLSFLETALGDLMLMLNDSRGIQTSARSASDGTLRFIALVAALRFAEPGTLLVFEDLELGLHPARLGLLVELLNVAAARGCQIIATTHSPALLAALDASTLRDTLAFATGEDGTSAVRRVGGLPKFDDLIARQGIERLFTSRWLEY